MLIITQKMIDELEMGYIRCENEHKVAVRKLLERAKVEGDSFIGLEVGILEKLIEDFTGLEAEVCGDDW